MVVLRDFLMDLLYSRHTLSYLHFVVAAQFPLVIRINHPSQYNSSLLCLLFQRNPKGVGGSLNLQFNEIINVSPGGSIPYSGTKTSRLAEYKAKHFASESLVVIVNGTTQFPALDS